MLEDSPGLIGFMERLAELTRRAGLPDGRPRARDVRGPGLRSTPSVLALAAPARRLVGAYSSSSAQDFVRVLPEPRRREPRGWHPAVHADRVGDEAEQASCRVVDLLDRGRTLGRREDLVQRSDRCAGNRRRLQRREPLGGGPARKLGRQQRDQVITVSDARRVRREAFVRGELRDARSPRTSARRGGRCPRPG